MENGESKTVLNVAHKSVQMLLVEYTTSKDKIDVEDNEQKEDDNESKENELSTNNNDGYLNTSKNIKIKKSSKENIKKEFNPTLILDSFETYTIEGDYNRTMRAITDMPYEKIAHQKVDNMKNTIFHLAAKDSKLNALLAMLDYLEEKLNLKYNNSQLVSEKMNEVLLQENSKGKTVFQIASEDQMWGKNLLEVFRYYTTPHLIVEKKKKEAKSRSFGGEDNRNNKVELLEINKTDYKSYLEPGLNLGFICENTTCKNNNKMGWLSLSYGNTYLSLMRFRCPVCNERINRTKVRKLIIYKADYCFDVSLYTEYTKDGYKPILQFVPNKDFDDYEEKNIQGCKIECDYSDESVFCKYLSTAPSIYFKVRKYGTLTSNRIF